MPAAVSLAGLHLTEAGPVNAGIITDILTTLDQMGHHGLTKADVLGVLVIYSDNFDAVLKPSMWFPVKAVQADDDAKHVYFKDPIQLRIIDGQRTGIGTRQKEGTVAHEMFHIWDKLVRHGGDLRKYHEEHESFRSALGIRWYLDAPWEKEASEVEEAYDSRMEDPCGPILGCGSEAYR